MNKNKNSMKTSSKIIISVLVLFVLILAGGWSYTEGYLTGIFSNNDELEAKISNYPNYIERFSFDGIDFVQNVALAVPTPETVKTYSHLDGTLTLKHNESKNKVLYVDTPNRVSLTSDDKAFYYSSESLTDENNITFTRHKFYLMPNVEYDFSYKILNINEFVDHSGNVSFTLRDLDLTISQQVKTEFISPLENYVDIELGMYFNNSANKYFIGNITKPTEITIKNRKDLSGKTKLSIEGVMSLQDMATSYEAYFFTNTGFIPRKSIITSDDLKIKLDGSKIIINDIEMPTGRLNVYNKEIRLGGIETTYNKVYDTNKKIGGVLNLYLYRMRESSTFFPYLCRDLGYQSYVAYTRYGGSTSTVWSHSTGSWSSTSSYWIGGLTCSNSAFVDDTEIILKEESMLKPYLLDSKREIKIPNLNISEIKLNFGDSIKTLTLNKFSNFTSFIIPIDYELKELELENLFIKINGVEMYLPIYSDSSRSQTALWEMFDRKLEEFGG